VPLEQYRKKRDFKQTPEPEGVGRAQAPPSRPTGGKSPLPKGAADKPKAKKKTKLNRFVVQEHHATSLHWDFRLERDGVLVSWAVPKGVPPDPKQTTLLSTSRTTRSPYIDFAGDIPEGLRRRARCRSGTKGTYEVIKWTDREVMVVLHGERVEGRYVLFQTNGRTGLITA